MRSRRDRFDVEFDTPNCVMARLYGTLVHIGSALCVYVLVSVRFLKKVVGSQEFGCQVAV
jgi:hypothetical protein